MKGMTSATVLLAVATILHAMRVIVLSLLLHNRDFGAVSTILLITALFSEFGSVGFGQLVYNQPLFTPGRRSWRGYRVQLFMLAGMALASVLSIAVVLLIDVQAPFGLFPLWMTVWCNALNMIVLSACRASSSRFTHPVAYAIKAAIISVDIVILGVIRLPVEHMALWGEVLALPFLLVYAWRVGLLHRYPHLPRAVLGTIFKNRWLGLTAITSSATGVVFFNQDRVFGATFLTLEQMGVVTKLLLPKTIAAQGSFLFAVQFHRWVVSLDPARRDDLLGRMARADTRLLVVLVVLLLIGGWLIAWFDRIVYHITADLMTGTAVALTALMFFINPYANILQANSRFSQLARANIAAIVIFAIVAIAVRPGPAGVVTVCAISALAWFLLVRHTALGLRVARPGMAARQTIDIGEGVGI